MAKPFDAVSKHIVDYYPGDWLALGGLPAGKSIEIVDADLSIVSTAADKLIRVEAPDPYAAHLEFQSSPDDHLDERVLVYSVLGRKKLSLPVWSVVFMLRPEAMTPSVKGSISEKLSAEQRLEFGYKIVRVWELDPKILLAGGIGTLPLAPISAARESDLDAIVKAMQVRVDSAVAPPEVGELWAATQVLLGLRYSNGFARQLLRGVHGMKESTTYQAIVEEGMEKGIEKGIEKGKYMHALSDLLRHGTKRLGAPSGAIKARVEAISDVVTLENLTDRVLDGSAHTWESLLASIH